LIPIDSAIQTYSRDTLAHLGRGVLPFFGRIRRKEWVTSQFETGQQVREYAEADAQTQLDARHRAARIALLHELLAEFPAGELLDAGCGPGVLVRSLLESAAFDYRITVIDQSEAMIGYCITHTGTDRVRAMVGDIENLPFADGSFDVTISTGVLEYTDASAAVRQLARVTKPGGAVVVSMLNPLSPYWMTDWYLYRPAVRFLARTMRLLRIRRRQYHGESQNVIRALRSRALRQYLRQSGLIPADAVYFGFTPLIRPLDRIARIRRWSARHSDQLQPIRGWRRWMATGYVIVAHRQDEPW
jgi:ubiquinone/menaquinone biosynthesis C-methylase UbiE